MIPMSGVGMGALTSLPNRPDGVIAALSLSSRGTNQVCQSVSVRGWNESSKELKAWPTTQLTGKAFGDTCSEPTSHPPRPSSTVSPSTCTWIAAPGNGSLPKTRGRKRRPKPYDAGAMIRMPGRPVNPKIAELKQLPISGGLKPAQLRTLASNLDEVTIPKGEKFVSEGRSN